MSHEHTEEKALSAADLVHVAAPLQLFPAWLPGEPPPIVSHCVIHDAGTPVADHPGAVLLLVGMAPDDDGTETAVREAGAAGYAAVVVKARGTDPGRLTGVAESSGVAVLVAADGTDWRDIDRLVGALVDAQGSRTPAYAQVRPGDLFGLANAIAFSVGGATAIEDRNGRMFAHSNLPHQEIDDIRLRSITDRVTPTREGDPENYLRVRNATHPIHFKSDDDVHASRLAMPVRAGDELLGLIWVLDGKPRLGKGAPQALEDAATVAALHLLQVRQQENGQRWNRGQVLSSLLTGRMSSSVAAALIGIPVATPCTLLALVPEASEETTALGVARTINLINLYCEAWHPMALATSVDDIILALLPMPTGGTGERSVVRFAHQVSDTVRRTNGFAIRIGIGPVAATLDDVQESRRLAELTLSALAQEGGESRVATVADVRSRVILTELAETGRLELALPGDPLAQVLEHDRARGTAYAESLLAYLNAFGDTTSAAGALMVHENTLRYRIRRLQELFSLDLDDPDTRLVMWLRLRLLRLQKGENGTGADPSL
jgi:hypothetical protein